MDDDTIGRISSFPIMNRIRNFVDKENLTSMLYTRDNVCAVEYIKKEYLCMEIKNKLMNTSITKHQTYEDNQQDISSNCNSIHDTDSNTSEDCDDKKYHQLNIYHQTYYIIYRQRIYH